MPRSYPNGFGLSPRYVQKRPGLTDEGAKPTDAQPLFGGGKVASNYQALFRGGYAWPKWAPSPVGPGEDDTVGFPFDYQPLAQGGHVPFPLPKPSKGPQAMAEGGEAGEDYECSPQEKVAAQGVMEAMGMKGGNAEKVAQALKAFFMIADSGGEPDGDEGGQGG